MIVYHGSSRNFKHLRIGKRLVRNDATLDNEGAGIYFSLNRKTAEAYGKYLYTLEINDSIKIPDFREINTCRQYIEQMISDVQIRTGKMLRPFLDTCLLSQNIQCGRIPVNKMGEEIQLHLDSLESYYAGTSLSKQEQICSMLNAYAKKHLQIYLFPHMITDIGIAKTTDENIIRIVNKEIIYKERKINNGCAII